MAVPNPKNFALTGAASDLGLGDMLQQQVQDQSDELKKKRMAGQPTAPLFGAAAMDLMAKTSGFSF